MSDNQKRAMKTNDPTAPKITLRELVFKLNAKGFYLSEKAPLGGFVPRFENWNERADQLFGNVPMFEASPRAAEDEAGLLQEYPEIAFLSNIGTLQTAKEKPRQVRIYF